MRPLAPALTLVLVLAGSTAFAQVIIDEEELELTARPSLQEVGPPTEPVSPAEGAPDLASADTLRALLPDRIGDFVFYLVSVPDGFAGRPGEPSVAANMIYEDGQGTSLFVVVEQHRDPARARERRERAETDVLTGAARDTLLQGRPAYLVGDGARIVLFVGSGMTVSTYVSGGEATLADLVRALDLAGLEALDRSYVRAFDLAAVSAFDRDRADRLGSDGPAAEAEAALPLRALAEALPEQAGEYDLARLSASPYAGRDGWADERGRTLEARYRAHDGRGVDVALSHFRRESARSDLSLAWWAGDAWLGDADETALGGHTAFTQGDPPAIAAFVGETVEVTARPAEEDESVDVLRAVVGAVDLDLLSALDRDYVEALRRATEPDAPAVEAVTGVEGDVDCDAFNADLRAEAAGDVELAPWVVFLAEAQAETAEFEEDLVSFPKAGNAWLGCVREGDLLWAPIEVGGFLRRVTLIWEFPDRAAFRTEQAGLTDVILRTRGEVDSSHQTP